MKFRISYLLYLCYAIIGLFMLAFSFYWDKIKYVDPSQFWLTMMLAITIIIVSIIGYILLKIKEDLNKFREIVFAKQKQDDIRRIDFEDYVRENIK
jgi:amino acid permease